MSARAAPELGGRVRVSCTARAVAGGCERHPPRRRDRRAPAGRAGDGGVVHAVAVVTFAPAALRWTPPRRARRSPSPTRSMRRCGCRCGWDRSRRSRRWACAARRLGAGVARSATPCVSLPSIVLHAAGDVPLRRPGLAGAKGTASRRNAWRIASCSALRGKGGETRAGARTRGIVIRIVVSASDAPAVGGREARARGPRGPSSASIWPQFFAPRRHAAGPNGARTAVGLAAGLAVWRWRSLPRVRLHLDERARCYAVERELDVQPRRRVREAAHRTRARRDDARQQLWEKLFVGAPRPRILDTRDAAGCASGFASPRCARYWMSARSRSDRARGWTTTCAGGSVGRDPSRRSSTSRRSVPEGSRAPRSRSRCTRSPPGPQRAPLLVRARDDGRSDRRGLQHPSRHRRTAGRPARATACSARRDGGCPSSSRSPVAISTACST